ncbi:Kelch-like protein 17 [Nymphon striatum]|nr:Kelch-like protein 17 [Nymphon striatum]
MLCELSVVLALPQVWLYNIKAQKQKEVFEDYTIAYRRVKYCEMVTPPTTGTHSTDFKKVMFFNIQIVYTFPVNMWCYTKTLFTSNSKDRHFSIKNQPESAFSGECLKIYKVTGEVEELERHSNLGHFKQLFFFYLSRFSRYDCGQMVYNKNVKTNKQMSHDKYTFIYELLNKNQSKSFFVTRCAHGITNGPQFDKLFVKLFVKYYMSKFVAYSYELITRRYSPLKFTQFCSLNTYKCKYYLWIYGFSNTIATKLESFIEISQLTKNTSSILQKIIEELSTTMLRTNSSKLPSKKIGFSENFVKSSIVANLTPQNCIKRRIIANSYDENVQQIIEMYICKNFMDVIQDEDALNDIYNLDYHTMERIANSSELAVDSEWIIFKIVSQWMNEEEKKSKKRISQLMNSVRFDHINEQKLMSELTTPDTDFSKDVLKEKIRLDGYTSLSGNTAPRKYLYHLFVVGGRYSDHLQSSQNVQILPLPADAIGRRSNVEWKHLEELPVSRTFFGITCSKGKVYVCGGINDRNEILSSLLCYDSALNKWYKLANMPDKNFLSHSEGLYALGGKDSEERTNTVFYYNVENYEWNELEGTMIKHRARHCSVLVQDEIYVIGGVGKHKSCEKIVLLEKDKVLSILIPSTNHGRCYASACLHSNGKIYVAGGVNEKEEVQTSVEFYSPSSKNSVWTLLASRSWLKTKRKFAEIVSSNSNIYIVGGQDENSSKVTTVEALNPNYGYLAALFGYFPQWQVISIFGQGLVGHGAVVKYSLSDGRLEARVNMEFSGAFFITVVHVAVNDGDWQRFITHFKNYSFLWNELTPVNYIDERMTVDPNDDEKIQEIELNIAENFMDVTNPHDPHHKNDFNMLTFKMVIDIVSSSKLKIDSELYLYEVLKSWIQHARSKERDQTELDDQWKQLLDCINFKDIDENLKRENLSSVEGIFRNELLREILSEERQNRERLQKMQITPLYNSKGKSSRYSWEHLDDLEEHRSSFGIVCRQGKIYICGGCNHKMDVLSSLKCYDISSKEWTSLKSMGVNRVNHTLVEYEGKLIVCGGNETRNGTNTVYFYDIENDTWEETTPMNTIRHGHCAVVFYDELYVIGGYGSDKKCEKMILLGENRKWTEIMPMMNVRNNAGACWHKANNRIYVAGGENERYEIQRSVEYYSPNNDIWTLCQKSFLNIERRYGKLVSCHSILYIIGGQNENMKTIDTVEALDTSNENYPKWFIYTKLEKGILNHGVTTCEFKNRPPKFQEKKLPDDINH